MDILKKQLGDSVSIADGLERHGEDRLAAVAYALAWTRARGRGGWLTFGGETELDSLAHASRIDPVMARKVVAEEIQRAVAASYGRGIAKCTPRSEAGLPAAMTTHPSSSTYSPSFRSSTSW